MESIALKTPRKCRHSSCLCLQMFRFDLDSVLPRRLPNDVTHIQFREWKRHTVEGLDIGDYERLPKALLKERARLHIVLIPHIEGMLMS